MDIGPCLWNCACLSDLFCCVPDLELDYWITDYSSEELESGGARVSPLEFSGPQPPPPHRVLSLAGPPFCLHPPIVSRVQNRFSVGLFRLLSLCLITEPVVLPKNSANLQRLQNPDINIHSCYNKLIINLTQSPVFPATMELARATLTQLWICTVRIRKKKIHIPYVHVFPHLICFF